MIPNHIDLVCPYCKQRILQLPADARPIQEQKCRCPACGRHVKIASMKTPDGETFQRYRRLIDPNAKVSVYIYGT